MTEQQNADGGAWPSLPFEEWRETCATLHMWTQVVGKVRLAQAPHVNHWWQVPLYVSARGLTTTAVPYRARVFQIDFDFAAHRLRIQTGEGDAREVELAPRTATPDGSQGCSVRATVLTSPRGVILRTRRPARSAA